MIDPKPEGLGFRDVGRLWGDAEVGWFRWTGERWEPCAVLVCAWCTKVQGPAPDLSPGEKTHGLCPECRPKLDAEIAGLEADLAAKGRAAGECVHGRRPDEWCTGCESET